MKDRKGETCQGGLYKLNLNDIYIYIIVGGIFEDRECGTKGKGG